MKTIILSPKCSGKTTFKNNNENAICGEFLSSQFNEVKGFKMGFHAALMPTSHPYYKSWDDIYKIGVDIFWKEEEYNNKYLIFNGAGIVDWIKKIYFWDCGPDNMIIPQDGINIKIVLIDKDLHYNYFLEKMKDETYDLSLREILINNKDFINEITNWEYINLERKIYKNLSKTYNIPIFNSFEEACK